MMAINKRRYSRLDSVINGTFFSLEDNTQGDIMMTNFSRDGFKASLSKPVVPGRMIQFQIRYNDHTMPVFATGKVVWIREKKRDLTYGFDAGIHLAEEDSILKQKAIECDFNSWHIKQVAEFARQRGYLVKHFPDKAAKLSYFLPAVFISYLIAGAAVSFVNTNIALVFLASVLVYFMFMFATTTNWLFTEKSYKSFSEKINMIFPVTAARISAHISYGLFFIKGLFARKA